MNTAYPSNLTLAQYELISDLIPDPKPGGRPRSVDLWEVLNALFYILVEGVRWRSLPRDFPAWPTVYKYFRTWRKDGAWVQIHDRLRDWTRIEQGRDPSPSEASIDSQTVKSAAMLNQAIDYRIVIKGLHVLPVGVELDIIHLPTNDHATLIVP
jgi:transposase